jgi:hypothetical protein
MNVVARLVQLFRDLFAWLRAHPGLVLLATMIAMLLVLGRGSALLITGEAPLGGRSLQQPDSAAEVMAILNSWQTRDALDHARRHVMFDFAFILVYVASFSYLCWWLGKRLAELEAPRLRWGARWGIAATIAAGVLDAIENTGMLSLIAHHGTTVSQTTIHLVYWCAAAKFLLLALVIVLAWLMDVQRMNARLTLPRSSSR